MQRSGIRRLRSRTIGGPEIHDKETDIFTLSWHEDISAGDGRSNHARHHCLDGELDTTYDGLKSLAYWECHGDFGNQLIKYLPKTQVNKNYYVTSLNNYVTICSAIVQANISFVYCPKRSISPSCKVQWFWSISKMDFRRWKSRLWQSRKSQFKFRWTGKSTSWTWLYW